MDGDHSRRRDNHSRPDFLSDLPLSIIQCILELVPFREVVRTCILSRRWRYIWASLPQLVFDAKGLEWQDLKNIITNVLSLHNGPIHKFRLVCPIARENSPDIDDHWLLCLSRNEIRDLFLGLRCSGYPYQEPYPLRLPRNEITGYSSLYSCQTLTHLELYNCILPPPPPTLNGFSCLRSLVLRHVNVPSNIVESLVANSPLLEKFTCCYSAGSELRISAPNLNYFELEDCSKEFSLYAPLVAEVSVTLDEDDFSDEQQSSGCNYTNFLGGFTNLERLYGHSCFTKYLSFGIESYDRSLVFHHLKLIRLRGVYFQDADQLIVVGHLMMGAPNLEWLSISPDYSKENPYIPYSDFGCAPNFTFNNLRFIRIEDLRGLPCEMEIVEYLLKSSPVLETMDLMSWDPLEADVVSQLMSELLSYFRASPNAEVSTSF